MYSLDRLSVAAIPKTWPPRSSVYDYFDLGHMTARLERIHHALYDSGREREQREASPTAPSSTARA